MIVGQDAMLERLLVSLLAGGHVLLEGVPGLAKTLTVKTMSQVVGGSFNRVQFTPDLVPADLVGTRIYRPDTGSFDIDLGPVFANFVLADEINRAPAKVQSALLEVMQEQQVTIGGTTYPVPRPFLVMATQNPIESEGTYALPEAQVDRFLMKIVVGYPSFGEEAAVVGRSLGVPATVSQRLSLEDLERISAAARGGPRRPRDDQLCRRPDDGDPRPRRLRPQGDRPVHRVRRQPPRVARPRPGGPRARDVPRPTPHHRARTSATSRPTSCATASCSPTTRSATASPPTPDRANPRRRRAAERGPPGPSSAEQAA